MLRLCTILLCVCIAHPASAQQPAGPAGRGGGPSLPSVNRASHRPAPPYTGVRTTAPSLPGQTIYQPDDLSKLGSRKMPIVAYGNGGCAANGGASAEPFLLEMAGNGYLVGAGGNFVPPPPPPDPGARRGAPADPAARRGGPPARGPVDRTRPAPNQTATAVLTEFIDWAIAENGRAASPYRNRIDTSKMAMVGHSCGGLQALAAGDDRRVTTLIILNSGTIPAAGIPTADGGFRPPAGYTPSTEQDLTELHTPVLYLIGGPTDQAYAGSQADYKAITKVPLFMGNYPVGHGATYREPRGGLYGALALEWLDWQLKGVAASQQFFAGPRCTLCTADHWTVERKNLD